MIKKILIIDDDSSFASTMSDRLDFEGYEVVTASDGSEGLDAVERERPDLIVLDILMPKLNGYAILKMLKSRNNKAKVIICTGRSDVMDAVKGEGISGFLVKPFDPIELVNMVNVTFQLAEELRKEHRKTGEIPGSEAPRPTSTPSPKASPTPPAAIDSTPSEVKVETETGVSGDDDSEKKSNPPKKGEKKKKNYRVLIIDDEEDFTIGLKDRLEFEGFIASIALNGQDGLEMTKKERPDLILLDVMMPKIDGYMVCRLLKFDEKYQNIPIIMLTARMLDEDRELGLSSGADEYITKPLDFDELILKMKKVLDID
jgi:DNA-binding response OmpR family regulator